MSSDEQSTLIGVFRDRTLAEHAIDELQRAGWENIQGTLLGQGTGGLLETIRSALSTGEPLADNPSDELSQLDLPEDQYEFYQRELKAGYFVVIVRTVAHRLEARDILHRYGAYHIFMISQMGGEHIVPILKEVPHVEKHAVDVGEIRIHKRVITEEKTFTVPVMREEVTIERFPLHANAQPPSQFEQSTEQNVTITESRKDNLATDQSSETEQAEEVLTGNGTLRILVHEEQVMINKQTVVVEEIVVHKDTVQEIKHLVEPVRYEEVSVERKDLRPS